MANLELKSKDKILWYCESKNKEKKRGLYKRKLSLLEFLWEGLRKSCGLVEDQSKEQPWLGKRKRENKKSRLEDSMFCIVSLQIVSSCNNTPQTFKSPFAAVMSDNFCNCPRK